MLVNKTKVFILLFMILLYSLSLTGCWGKREIEDLAFVQAAGIDKGEKPGTYQVTYQVTVPKKGAEGASDVFDYTITIESVSIEEANSKLIQILNKDNFPGTIKLIIIGKEAAKNGLNRVLDFYQRLYQLRRSVYLLLAEDKAQDILYLKPRNKKVPTQNLLSMIQYGNKWSVVPIVRLGHYLTVLARASESPVIPIVKPLKAREEGLIYTDGQGEESGELCLAGAGIFHGDRLVDELTDLETKGYLWLQNEVKTRLLDTSDMGEPGYGARIMKSSTDVKVEPKDGVMSLNYSINAQASLTQIQNGKQADNPAEMKEIVSDAEHKLAKVIEKECLAALEKSKESGLDFLGMGRQIEMKKPKFWKEIKDRWEELLLDTPVTVDVKVVINNAGTSYGSPVNPQETGKD